MNNINKSDFFILVQTNPSDWALNAWIQNGIDSEIVYKPMRKLIRALRRVWIKFKLPCQSIWYNDWNDKVKHAKVVIVHISSLTLDLPKYINRLNPYCKVIAWYWNAVVPNIEPHRITGEADLWSFDPENCKQYNMSFNHQYYFHSLVLQSTFISYDVYFCGSDSGRGKILTDLYIFLTKSGVKANFQIVNPVYDGIPNEIKSDYVSYEIIRQNIASSKAIIEIVRKGQSGATVRVMEALFFHKKLITNNRQVLNEPFYNKEQFFVIDNNFNEIIDFLNLPIPDYDYGYIQKYDFITWLTNFIGES